MAVCALYQGRHLRTQHRVTVAINAVDHVTVNARAARDKLRLKAGGHQQVARQIVLPALERGPRTLPCLGAVVRRLVCLHHQTPALHVCLLLTRQPNRLPPVKQEHQRAQDALASILTHNAASLYPQQTVHRYLGEACRRALPDAREPPVIVGLQHLLHRRRVHRIQFELATTQVRILARLSRLFDPTHLCPIHAVRPMLQPRLRNL